MVDEFSETNNRGELYRKMDDHIKSSRTSEKSLFLHGKPESERAESISGYGKVYQKTKSAFQDFLEFIIFRKREHEDYEELEGTSEDVKEEFEDKMETLDKEEELIHDAEEEISQRKRQTIWGLLSRAFKREKKKPEEVYEDDEEIAEERFEHDYEELDDEEKLLEAEEQRVIRQRRGLIWNLLYKLDLISTPEDELEGKEMMPEEKSLKEYPEVTEVKKDMKTVALFSVELMRRLSPHQIERVKDKAEFKKFKEVLKKHEIIK